MGCRSNRVKDNCIKTPSRCVFYNLDLPEFSKLNLLHDCITLEDTTNDTYKSLEFVLNHLNTSDFGCCKSCLTYPKTKSSYDGKDVVLVKDILKVFEEEICSLKKGDSSENSSNFDSILKGLDLKCLKECDTKVTSLISLLQLLINEICKLKEK